MALPIWERIGAIIETRLRFEDPHVESTPKASQQDAESPDGFRLRTIFPLRRGQTVEVIPNEALNPIPCRVVWVGKRGSKCAGNVGLQSIG